MRKTALLFALCGLLLWTACNSSKPQPATVAPSNLQVSAEAPGVKAEKPATVRLHVALDGKPLEGAAIHGTQNMTTMDMGKTELEFKPAGAGVYEAATQFSMGGPWKIELTVQSGGNTMKSEVKLDIPE